MGRVARIGLATHWRKTPFMLKTCMENQEEMAPSPRQPFNRQGVLRIPGLGQTLPLTTGNVHRTQNVKNFRFGIINVATLREKEEEIVEMMKMKRLSILAVSETRLRDKGDKIIHEDYRLIYSGNEQAKHGVGFFLEPNIAPLVEKVIAINERLIGIDLKLKFGISMIQVYAPQQGRPTAEKEQFYQQLQELVEEMKYQDNIIICGDFNGHVGCERRYYEWNIGDYSIGDRNEAGQRLLDFTQINNLQIMNTFFKHRESQKWTWYRYNYEQQAYTQKSMIDLFLTNNKTLFCDVKSVPSVSLDADHRLVLAKLRIIKPKENREKGAKRYKLGKLREQTTFDELNQRVYLKLQNIGERQHEDDIESLWSHFKKGVSEAADEVLGEKVPYRGKKKRTPWWGEEVKNSVKFKMKQFRKWMKTRREEDRLEYVLARNETQRIKRKAKEDSWKKIGEDLKEDLNGNKKLLYSLANNYRGKRTCPAYSIKDKNDSLLTETEEIAERWREYFKDLLNVPNHQVIDVNQEREFENSEDEDYITVEEVKRAMKKMKNGKSPGDDGLPVEIFKAGGVSIIEQLVKIYNTAYIREAVPSDWQRGVISPILKKGDKTVCDNYRGITLLSHAGKIYTRILEARLRQCVEDVLDDCQYGFRPGRSTTNPVFVMKMILEKSWEWGIDKYALFIDLEKAFDRVDRNHLWRILHEEYYSVPTKLIRAIRSIYSQCTSIVRTHKIESREFSIDSGVRQGDVLSPLLFIIFMDKCFRDVNIGACGEETLAYADDVVVVANSITDIQNVATRWWQGMIQNGMKINTRKGKTELVVISRNREQLYDVYMGQDKLHQVENYTHLGVNVGDTNRQEIEINNRIAKYNRNVGLMYPLLRDPNIPLECKVTIYQSILKPILLYGSEVWSLTTKTQSKLQAAEMRVLRTIKGVTRRDKIRNTTIREELRVTSLMEEIERTKLRWYGHVMRMDDNCKAKKYLMWKPEGKRPVGRPRKRWIDGVKTSLERRDTSLQEVENNRRYEDRDDWRRFLRGSPADRQNV